MRHLVGAVLAAVMAAAVFFSGWAFITLCGPRPGGWSPATLAAVSAMAGTGLLLGVLVSARRISPLAAGLPGIFLLGWSAVQMFGSVKWYKWSTAVHGAVGAGFSQILLYGMATLLGALMMCPMLIPSRWRRAGSDGGQARAATGVALAAAVAFSIFLADGWGIQALTGRVAPGQGLASGRDVASFVVLAAAGLLLGILLAVRSISPLAAGLPGIVLLAWSGMLAFDQSGAVRIVPLQHEVFGQGFTDILAEGLGAVLGGAMIIPVALEFLLSRAVRDDKGERLPQPAALTT
jgi:hypothetical protein